MAKTETTPVPSERPTDSENRVRVVAVFGVSVVLLASIIACALVAIAFLNNAPWN